MEGIESPTKLINDDATVDRLVTENIALAKFFANKSIDIDYDEAFSRAMRGLLRAARGFDASRCPRFGTYASLCIRSELHHVRLDRKAKKRQGITFSMDAPISDENDSSIANTIPDPNADPLKHVDDDTNRNLTLEALGELSPQYREIITRRFGIERDPETLISIGESMGVTRERIRQIENLALEKLQRIVKAIRHKRELAETIEGAKAELKVLKRVPRKRTSSPHRRRRNAIIRGSLFQIRLRKDGQAFALAA